jgi:hypothetical protein
MRATEFKEKFLDFESRLTTIQTDLLLREVSGLSDAQAEAFKVQLTAAEAHRKDLEAMMEELRAENARLMEQVEAGSSQGLKTVVEDMRAQNKTALDALASQAAEQKKLLEAMRAKGVEDIGELSAKMNQIAANAASSAAAAAAATVSATATAAATEKLAMQHAQAMEELKAMMADASGAAATDMRRTQERMDATQAQLTAVINSSNVQLKSALEDVQRRMSGEVKAAAQQMIENMDGVGQMQKQQLSILSDVVRQTAAMKATLSKIDKNVEELLRMMQQLLSAKDNAPPDPQARKDALLAALSKIRNSAAAADVTMQGVNEAKPGEAVQSALKSVQRAVQLVGISALSLEEKTKILAPALTPRMNVQKVDGGLEVCRNVSAHTQAEVIADKLAPLRCALDELVAANEEANNALTGSGGNAIVAAKMPVGWARELWTYAFTVNAFSGALASLVSAKNSGYPGACDDARVAQFVMQKQQDAALGGGNTVDVYEWAAMAQAAGDPFETVMKPNSEEGGLEAQRMLDRLMAYANANMADDSFKVSVELIPNRDFIIGAAASGITYRARLGNQAELRVTATQDCYFYLVEQGPTGNLCPLVPWNSENANVDNRLIANMSRLVPCQGDGFSIWFGAPAGLERVFVFASQKPIPEWNQMASIENNVQRTAALSRCLAGIPRDLNLRPERRDIILPNHSSGGNVQNKVAFSVLTFQLFE